jgi:hypothetical protein
MQENRRQFFALSGAVTLAPAIEKLLGIYELASFTPR